MPSVLTFSGSARPGGGSESRPAGAGYDPLPLEGGGVSGGSGRADSPFAMALPLAGTFADYPDPVACRNPGSAGSCSAATEAGPEQLELSVIGRTDLLRFMRTQPERNAEEDSEQREDGGIDIGLVRKLALRHCALERSAKHFRQRELGNALDPGAFRKCLQLLCQAQFGIRLGAGRGVWLERHVGDDL